MATLKFETAVYILYFITVHVVISIYLRPTHAQLKHSLTHNVKNIKMFVSFLPYMFRSRD
jgi:hypothetical protein